MSGEIGMDLIDAITEWSDRVDEDLTQDDIDAIVRIQLAIDGGEWSHVDIGDYSAADLADLKADLHGVDAPDFTAWVIDETFAEFNAIPVADPSRLDDDATPSDEDADPDDEADLDDRADPDDTDRDEADLDGADVGDADPDDTADHDDSSESLDTDEDLAPEHAAEELADDSEPVETQEAPTPGGIFAAAVGESLTDEDRAPATAPGWSTGGDEDELLAGTSAADAGKDFFAELERNTTTSVTRAPVELKEGPDSLGPAFLPPAQKANTTRIGLSVLAVIALVAFVLAGIQLVNNVNNDEDVDELETVSVDEEEASDAADSEPPATADKAPEQEPTPNDDGDDGDDESTEANDESDSLLVQATATPEADLPPTESRVMVLTRDGSVLVVDLFPETFSEPTVVFDEDEAAVDMSLVQAGLAIVDDDGVVHVINLDTPSERVKVWRGGSLPDAQQIVDVGEQYGVLDATGSINLFDKNRAATASNVDTVWDATVGGTPPARSIDVYRDLLPFTIGNGEIRMVVTSADGNPISTIWDPANQPRAFNMAINEHGLLMGVGAGAVARYQWFDNEQPLQAVWDPLSGDRLPAIGYAGLDGRTAVVLDSGTVASVEDDGAETVLWDAEVSDLRATGVASSPTEVLLTLEDGSVLRVAADGSTEGRGTVWDASDDDVSSAAKVLVLDS